MTAVGYTSGDPNKVNVSGDTMTGDLILAGAGTDITVGGNATVSGILTDSYQGITGDVTRLLSSVLSTGIDSGGLLSINANPALIDISATTGWVYDYNAQGVLGPTNPKLTFVNFPGQTGIALTGPPAQIATFWLLTSAGAVVQQATPPTRVQFRTHLVLGVTGQSGGINFLTQSLAYLQGQVGVQLIDLIRGLASFVIGSTSNVITPNGVNLKINTSGGPIFSPAFGLPNYQDPHVKATLPQTPITFRYATGTAVLPALVTNLDVANYDPNGLGVVTPIGGGANTTTTHRIYASAAGNVTDQVAIEYGQHTYASLSAATAAVGSGVFVPNPVFEGLALVGWISAIRTATNLSDPTQAAFTRASKFANP